jgi:hypothetical protein
MSMAGVNPSTLLTGENSFEKSEFLLVFNLSEKILFCHKKIFRSVLENTGKGNLGYAFMGL